MGELLGALNAAVAVALATTFDDNIYLTGFFSETSRRFHPLHVVVGELLGFTVLMLLSVLGMALASTFPPRLTGWLGALPILIGLGSLWELLQRRPEDPGQLLRDSAQGARAAQVFRSRMPSLWQVLRDRQTYGVSAITISNGGNNLAVYIPLLGNATPRVALLTILVCYAAVACWLFLSFRLTRLPGVAVILSRYASRLFPFVLMWLGFRILHDSGVLPSWLS